MPKQYNQKMEIQSRLRGSLQGEARKAGIGRKRGWFHRFRVGSFPQRGRPGKFALVEAFMKRVGFGNWYSEKVIDEETGQVINQCDEPLDQHQKHGSAKPKPPQSN
jgi:hypothetical protein